MRPKDEKFTSEAAPVPRTACATKVRRVADHLIEYHYMDRVLFEAMMQEPQEPARVLYFLFTPPRVALSTSHSRFVAAMQRAIERGLECKPEGEGTERAA